MSYGTNKRALRQSQFEGGWKRAIKTVEFDGTSGNGANSDIITLFNVTGHVSIALMPIVSEDCTGSGAKLSLGLEGDTDIIITDTTVTDMTEDTVWYSDPISANDDWIVSTDSISKYVIPGGKDIQIEVGGADITDGTIDFYCFWSPVSTNGLVSVA